MKVAVVIPCYNVEAHVANAVRSVWAQTHTDLDVVAVDDGSSDGTRSLLHRLAAEGQGRLRVLEQANKGACAARNLGLAHTDGAYVQFLDADDTLAPGKVERQLAIALKEQADVVVGAYANMDGAGRSSGAVLPLIGDAWEALVRTRMGTTSANLFRRKALMAAGAWEETLRSSQDYELLFRMLKRGAQVAWDEEVGAWILKRTSGSISRTNERANWLRYLDLRLAMRDHLRSLDPVKHATTIAAADQYLFMAIRVLSKHDRSAAFAAFDRMLPTDFVPDHNQATTQAYQRAYRWFGFRNAERIAILIGEAKRP